MSECNSRYAFWSAGILISLTAVAMAGHAFLGLTATIAIAVCYLATHHTANRHRQYELAGAPATALGFAEWEVHREMQRARHFGRPLSMVLMSFERRFSSSGFSDPMTVTEISWVASVLAAEIKSCDLLIRFDEGIVLVLPETPPDNAELAAARLTALLRASGYEAKTGVAGFPDQERSLSGLWELLLKRLREERNRAESMPDVESPNPAPADALTRPE